MSDQNHFHLYAGDGSMLGQRNLELPSFEQLESLDDPSHYVAEPGLCDAVNVALALGQPLLLTGEPGTGKTQLAWSLAHEIGLRQPLVFNVKTTSTARDLFYRYDSLRHFHDAQFRKDGAIRVDDYIEYEALGLAVLLSQPAAEARPFLPESLRGREQTRSVVLIDEIDKASRDLPNDILNEIEAMEFTVKETGRRFTCDPRYRPIVVLTSNSEKNLPDAFLRRCIFYHIEFPDRERLRRIIERRIKFSSTFTPDKLDAALDQFDEIRRMALKKLPATAELLAWLRILDRRDIDVRGAAEAVAFTYSTLAKNQDDLARIRNSSRAGKLAIEQNS
jgi:MoxR-like ATPase